MRLSVSAYVVGGSCTISVDTNGPANAWANVDDVTLTPGQVTRGIRGGDLSGLAKNEDFGATYASANGRPGDPVEILAKAGMNLGRLKVWVDPADGYNEVTHVVETAQRIKAAGMQLMVDFHYSDRWTDPGAQGVPAAWVGHTPEQLAVDVHDHTRRRADRAAGRGDHRGLRAGGQRDQPRDALALGPDVGRRPVGRRAGRAVGQPRRVPHGRPRRGQGGLARDQDDPAPHQHQQRDRRPDLVVRRGHRAVRAVRRDRAVLLRVLARVAWPTCRRRSRPCPTGTTGT